jgi:hypothetical protein
MPLLPAVAIVTAKLFERRTLWLAVLLPFLLIQHYVISFGVPWLPEEVVLARGPEARWTWNWNVVTQSYAGLWGKPITADWKVDEVIRKVTTANSAAPVRVGLAPDIPSFDAQAFEYEIALRKAPVVVSRISASDDTAAENHDYLLVSASDIGHTKGLDLVESFTLPGGAVISLLKTGNWGQRAISPR